jgi:DNA-binding transcriptional MocR family regulator
VKQRTGSPSRKLVLLTLANYADDTGCCWPSQETLSSDTEQSTDSVQRHLKHLEGLGLIRRVVRPMGAGRWASRTYFLNMSVAKKTKPQSAARSEPDQQIERDERDASRVTTVTTNEVETMPQSARDHAAPSPSTMPHPARDHAAPVRHEPSLEHSIEPSLEQSEKTLIKKPRPSAAERQMAFRESRKGVEVIQNRIAQRIGFDGWQVLQSISEADLAKATTLEERGLLDARAIEHLRNGTLSKESA